MKRIISLVTTMVILASLCLMPVVSMAEDGVVITKQSQSVKAAEGKSGGKADYQATLSDLALTIVSQPEDATVKEGEEVTFSFVTAGAAAYQWYFRAAPKDEWTAVEKDGTSAEYTFKAEAKFNGYQFRCVAMNKKNQVVSEEVTLTVISNPAAEVPAAPAADAGTSANGAGNKYDYQMAAYKPEIVSQPADVQAVEGAKAVFTVAAKNAVSYQWYYRTAPKAEWTAVKNGGNTDAYALTVKAEFNGYQFRCVVKNKAGQTTSDAATLTVVSQQAEPAAEAQPAADNAEVDAAMAAKKGLPVISAQPADQSVKLDQKVTFKLVASDATSYQWYSKKAGDSAWNAVKKDGASAVYTVTADEQQNGSKYRCLVSNKQGSVWSKTVTLTVKAAAKVPVITTQPKNQTVKVGDTVSFKVVASGATSYLWYYKSPNATSWTKSNRTTDTYTLTAKKVLNGYRYKCKVTNAAGSVYANSALLTVKEAPSITTQPANKTASVGDSVSFKVVASGATAYLWYYKSPNATSWTKSTKKTDTYALTAKKVLNGYQ